MINPPPLPASRSSTTSPRRLDPLFAPTTVAIVGASERVPYTKNLTHRLATRFDADHLRLVNPHRSETFGRATVPSLTKLCDDVAVDLAFLAVSADLVCAVALEARDCGVRACIVLSDELTDSRDAASAARARELSSIVSRSEMLLCGPGSLGVMNIGYGMEAFAGRRLFPVPPGEVSIIAQSGGLVQACIGEGIARNLGFSLVVASGSEVGLNAADYLAYFAQADDTRFVCAILEELRDEERFIDAVRILQDHGKQLCVLKLGASQAASRMALTHTGSISGRSDYYRALFDKLGVVAVSSLDELLDCTAAMTAGMSPGRRLRTAAVVATSGGAGAIACDLAASHGIDVPVYAAETQRRIEDLAGPGAQNPLEVSYQMRLRSPTAPHDIAVTLSEATEFDLVIINEMIRLTPEDMQKLSEVAASAKPVFALCATGRGLDLLPDGARGPRAEDPRLPIFPTVAGLVRAVQLLNDLSVNGGSTDPAPRAAPASTRSGSRSSDAQLGLLSDYESRRLLAEVGIESPRELILRPDEGWSSGGDSDLAFPICVKADRPGLAHRSEHGFVVTDLRTWAEVERAVVAVRGRAKATGFGPIAILVQEQVSAVAEMFIGIDATAGRRPLVTIGVGGVLVELLSDVVRLVPPVSETEIRNALSRLRCVAMLAGYRGRPTADLDALVAAVRDLVAYVDRPEQAACLVEVNPLLVREAGHGVCAVDALVRIEPEARSR